VKLQWGLAADQRAHQSRDTRAPEAEGANSRQPPPTRRWGGIPRLDTWTGSGFYLRMASQRLIGFLPSTRGFRFANSWRDVPVRQFHLGDVATLSLGDAARGLCGGMSFAVADLYIAGLPGPADAANPSAGTAKFDYIVDRQIASLDSMATPLRFYSLMRPDRPDIEPPFAGALALLGFDRHSRSQVMLTQEWPRVRALLDRGQPAMLGLVRVVSADPFQLNRNHQVLAYGYDLEGSSVSLAIYDPNWPSDDGVWLTFDTSNPGGLVSPTYSKADGPLYCFFSASYAASDPAPWR
jgi:hypothetical protein